MLSYESDSDSDSDSWTSDVSGGSFSARGLSDDSGTGSSEHSYDSDDSQSFESLMNIGKNWTKQLSANPDPRFGADAKAIEAARRVLAAYKFKSKDDPPIVTSAAAGDLAMVRALLALGVPIDACGQWVEIEWKSYGPREWFWKKDTALIAACRHGHLALVNFLLEHGADRNHRSCTEVDVYVTPQEAARKAGHLQIAAIFEAPEFEKDLATCKIMWEKSRKSGEYDQDSQWAYSRLADKFAIGQGTRKDKRQAAQWYIRAVDAEKTRNAQLKLLPGMELPKLPRVYTKLVELADDGTKTAQSWLDAHPELVEEARRQREEKEKAEEEMKKKREELREREARRHQEEKEWAEQEMRRKAEVVVVKLDAEKARMDEQHAAIRAAEVARCANIARERGRLARTTKWCPTAGCTGGDYCTFRHEGVRDLPPRCAFVSKWRGCRDGDKCPFNHLPDKKEKIDSATFMDDMLDIAWLQVQIERLSDALEGMG